MQQNNCISCGAEVFMNRIFKVNNKHKFFIGIGLFSVLLCSCDFFYNPQQKTNNISSPNSVTTLPKYNISRYDYLQFKENPLYAEYRDETISIYEFLYATCKDVLENNDDYKSNIVCQFEYTNLDIVSAVYFSFLHNNPEFYFLRNAFRYTKTIVDGFFCDVIQILFDDDYSTPEIRKDCNLKISNFKENFLSEFAPIKNAGDITQTFFVHDYILNSTYYEYVNGEPSSNKHAHNIMGAIDNDSATGSVCEGYAKTYQLLSDWVGLDTITVVGSSLNYGHMWNYTKHINSWYGVDVTFDDSESNTSKREYCLASKEVMEKNHFVGNSEITAKDFFQVPVPNLASK